MKKLLFGYFFLFIAPVSSAEPLSKDWLYVQSLAATCENFHGTAGVGVPEGSIPRLSGLKQDYFVEQMAAFKSGARQATVMHQLAKGFTQEQIQALATYFSKQP